MSTDSRAIGDLSDDNVFFKKKKAQDGDREPQCTEVSGSDGGG